MLHVTFNTAFKMWGLSLRKQVTSSASLTSLQDLHDSSLSVWPKYNADLWAKGNTPNLLAQSTFSLQTHSTASSFGSLFLTASKNWSNVYCCKQFGCTLSRPYDHEVTFVCVILSIGDEPEGAELISESKWVFGAWFFIWAHDQMHFLAKHISGSRIFSSSQQKNTVSFMLLLNGMISISFHAEDKIMWNIISEHKKWNPHNHSENCSLLYICLGSASFHTVLLLAWERKRRESIV